MAHETLDLPAEGIALCLSGGGFRATLFHIGALWRLNQFGYLPKLARISSVSGGSIAAGWLGACWKKLDFDQAGVAGNFNEVFVDPLRSFTSKNLDVWVILSGLLNPFGSIGDSLIRSYRKNLFGSLTLRDLPARPYFVFNASNAQTGALFRFSRNYLADYQIGQSMDPQIELAVVVAASSAFPPFLSPVRLKLNSTDFRPDPTAKLQREPFTSRIVLLDGGVYDNLGLETIQKNFSTILVSDAGGKMQPDPYPWLFWGIQAYRVLTLMDNQVRALRKRDILGMFTIRKKLTSYMRENNLPIDENIIKLVSRKGTYWGAFTHIEDYDLGSNTLPCPNEKTLKLALLPTRLWGFSRQNQERLINWGYAVCDAAMRRHVDPILPNNAEFPYPGGVG
jgi:NTE family protein